MASPTKALVTTISPLYEKILSLFPQQYFRFCFSYGSGVLKQDGFRSSKPILDMIFVVDDTEGFHGQNIHMNPSHYSALKYFGHNVLAHIQHDWPAKVYYNSLIPVPEEDVMLSYGVVSFVDLINDLVDWNYLHLAGRLHKPVKIIIPTNNLDLTTAMKLNLYSAIHAALLILPMHFTERELYWTIANLSYMGDVRLPFMEGKVKRIIDPQVVTFRNLYGRYLETLADYIEIPKDFSGFQTCMQDMSSNSRTYHLFQLPRDMQLALVKSWTQISYRRLHDTEEYLRVLSFQSDLSLVMEQSLKQMVFNSSTKQTAKDLLTIGLFRYFKYQNKQIVKHIGPKIKPYKSSMMNLKKKILSFKDSFK